MNAYINKRNLFWRNMIIGLLAIAAAGIIFHVFEAPIKNAAYTVSSPVTKVLFEKGNALSAFTQPFFVANQLNQQNNTLKQENQNLLSQVVTLQEALRQQFTVKEAADIAKQNNFSITAVSPVGLDQTQGMLLIDKGSKEGIAENMPVISSEKALYGKVVKVYDHVSQVMLISSSLSVVDVKIQSQNPQDPVIHGVVKGSGNFLAYLDLVPSDAQLNSGDVLVTSALEGIFPKDLLVGTIISSDKNDAKPFQTARITPFFSLANIDTLFVITNYKK